MRFQLQFIALAVLIMFIAQSSAAQSDNPRRLKNQGEEYFRVQEYRTALPLLVKYDSLEPGDPEINYKIGYSFYQTRNRRKALKYFEVAQQANKSPEDLDYLLARTYHMNHRFDEARKFYDKAFVNIPKGVDEEERKADITRHIEKTKFAEQQIANPKEMDILNMGDVVNTKFPEYVPVVSADETILIFTSRRPDTQGGGIDPMLNEWYEDLYITEKKNGEWVLPENMGPAVNSKEHDASIGLSPDGQKLFVYRSAKSAIGSTVAGDIYVSNLKSGDWTTADKMGSSINSKYWEPSASISADENTLYFASDRDGGYGGTDIYMVKRLPNGEWAQAQNLGAMINTPYDDDAPFIHPDGKQLYFSSKGHVGMGGFDIFVTERESEREEWGKPENVGHPINTSDDDIYIVWSADGSRGYFSSIRDDSYGDLDIYVVNKGLKNIPLVILKGHIYDRISGEPLGATITITDNATQELTGIYNSNPRTGKYTVILESGYDYGIAVDAVDHLFYSENLRVPDQNEYYEGIKDIKLSPIQQGRKIILRNIFFDMGKDDLREESITELNRVVEVMKEFPTLFIEIGGHTDGGEGTSSVQRLSQSRARGVVDYLVTAGIDSSRLYPFGYGDEFPLSERTDELGRQLNRRTEFVIVDERSAEGYVANQTGYYEIQKIKDPSFNLVGSEAPLLVLEGRSTNSFDLVKNLEKQGKMGLIGSDSVNSSSIPEDVNQELDINWKSLTVKQVDSLKVAIVRDKVLKEELSKINPIADTTDVELAPVAPEQKLTKSVVPSNYKLPPEIAKNFNEVYTLNMVFFDIDKSNIKGEEAWKLDHAAKLFKELKSKKLDIVGHTDNTNTLNYNYQLSKRRAQEVKTYLIGKGIPADRMTIEYKSYTDPLSSNDGPEGRALNRRVELFIK